MTDRQAFWHVYPDADFARVSRLVRELSVQLQITVPPVGQKSVALPADEARVIEALDEIEPGWRSMCLLAPPNESLPAADSEPVEFRLAAFDAFLRSIEEELSDSSWKPTAAQVADLHAHLGAAFHAWLQRSGRHP